MAWLILIGIVILVSVLYFKFFKIPKIKNVVFVDGSLGTGKTAYCVYLAIRLWKRNHRAWWFAKNILRRDVEEPYLISNIPLAGVEHQKLSLDVIYRKKRIPFKSIVLIDEASLLADQMDWKDKAVNDAIRDFAKLYRHLSHNGYLILNSQQVGDMHYGFRSVISDYLYIHHKTRLPFFSVLKVQEFAYSNDRDTSTIVNTVQGDIEDSLKMVFLPNRTFKRYDPLCYSIITDGLGYDKKTVYYEKGDSLKCKDIVTFRQGRYAIKCEVKEIKGVDADGASKVN